MTDFYRSLTIVIGIDDYGGGIPSLRMTANDARRVARILEENHG